MKNRRYWWWFGQMKGLEDDRWSRKILEGIPPEKKDNQEESVEIQEAIDSMLLAKIRV